jgi:glycosyltransferase involved in cell wall biosynthesis
MPRRIQDRKIVWFSFYSNEAPSVRYRGTYFLAYLGKEYGIRCDQFIPEKKMISAWRLLLLISGLLFGRKRKVVVIQRVSSFGIYALLLKSIVRIRKKRHLFLYDLDDAIYEEMENDSQIRWFMRNVHLVIVGSDELLYYGQRQNPNTVLITTPVIPSGLEAQPPETSPFVVGFIGCYWGTHFFNVRDLVFPALKQLRFPVALEIIGARNEAERVQTEQLLEGSGITVGFRDIVNWNDEEEINRAMLRWHIGLAPLKDTIVCRAKSAFKVKQYLNLGIPSVSTRVGENQKFIRHGQNGYLYDDPRELAELLDAHYRLPYPERELFAGRAKLSAKEFLLPVIAERWLSEVGAALEEMRN